VEVTQLKAVLSSSVIRFFFTKPRPHACSNNVELLNVNELNGGVKNIVSAGYNSLIIMLCCYLLHISDLRSLVFLTQKSSWN